MLGFCKSASNEEVAKQGHVLTPGHYVGSEAEEDDGIAFEDRFTELRAKLAERFAEGRRLEQRIEAALAGVMEGE